MQTLGPIQRGLPLLSALPRHWEIMIIDIKDCFFSIPLYPQDKVRFAFTLPSINHEEPDQRFQWRVLPQGMANSPTMCQMYVARAIDPIRKGFPKVRICHYMDDILLCSNNRDILQRAFCTLTENLKQKGLYVAPEKVQEGEVGNFLGSVITPDYISPQKVTIRRDTLKTLNDFQKLLGDINWIRSFLKITTSELQPLFKTLEGDPHITSPRRLTPEASKVLDKIEHTIQSAQLDRINPDLSFHLCVLPSPVYPTAVLWQEGPLLWIHPHSSPGKTLGYYPTLVAELALQGLQLSTTHFGNYPDTIICPYTRYQIQILCATQDAWAILRCSFPGNIIIIPNTPYYNLLLITLLYSQK